jgi:hypothetical protein
MIEEYQLPPDLQGIDLSPYVGLLDFMDTAVYQTLLELRNRVILVVTGNRQGKTKSIVRAKVIAPIMGTCPILEHNIRPEDKCRVIRLGAELLPEDKDFEVKNTVYPQIKYQLPPQLIRKDITARSPVMTVLPRLGGKPAQLEFTSYGQTSQSQAGPERKSIIVDEVCPYEYYEESLPRLATTNGQFIAGATPVEAGWMFTELYERARMYVRTPNVRRFILKQYGQRVPQVERTDSTQDICVLQAASDDNPIFKVLVDQKKKDILEGRLKKEDFPYENVTEYLDSVFMYDDPDTVAMRRYGIFRQITGAVHKEFQWSVHVIPGRKYFADGLPSSWKFARAIDYHQANNWAINWVALSPDDECFVWEEMDPSPLTWTTLGICKEMMDRSLDYEYRVNLIDKLASEKQVITNTSTTEDMNRIFRESGVLGYGKSTSWESWDDKTQKGTDKIRERLINSKICGKPFNNLQKVDGKEVRLPTLWIFDNCKETALSLKNWKKEEWLDRDSIVTKDPKDKFEQKWSHHNKALEAIFKDARFRVQNNYISPRESFERKSYYQGRQT